MARQNLTVFDKVGSTRTSTPREIASDIFSVQVTGIITATVDIEVSNDGTNWSGIYSFTEDGANSITGPYLEMRVNISSFTSGNITVVTIV